CTRTTFSKIDFPHVISRCGFVCVPRCSCNKLSYYCNCSIEYKVVLTAANECDPESHANDFEGIAAVDLFKESIDSSDSEYEEHYLQRFHSISLPVEFDSSLNRAFKDNARLAVFRGRLQLAQFYLDEDAGSYVLKAWELKGATTWILVHHVNLKRGLEELYVFLIAFHPEDGDAFFFARRLISANTRSEETVLKSMFATFHVPVSGCARAHVSTLLCILGGLLEFLLCLLFRTERHPGLISNVRLYFMWVLVFVVSF
ncbi:hypothetical protein TorRG33x02_032480, partial [Trema orientale]